MFDPLWPGNRWSVSGVPCWNTSPLAFLAVFLDDADAPDVAANPKMFEGPHAGCTFKRLEVRDLAAMKIASLLDMPDRPDRSWTADQWAALRQWVRDRLKR